MANKEKFFSLLDEFSHGMLVTLSPNREILGRPMRIVSRSSHGTLLMVSRESSEKVEDIRDNHLVCVTFQEADRIFLSVTGTGFVSNDRSRLQELWDEDYEVWFPEGPDSPQVVLLEVEPLFGEYWDNQGWQRIKLALESMKVFGSGETPSVDSDQHQRVDFMFEQQRE